MKDESSDPSSLQAVDTSFELKLDASENPNNSSNHSINVIESSMSEACEPKKKIARLDLSIGSQDSISSDICFLSPKNIDSDQKHNIRRSESPEICFIESKPAAIDQSDSIEIVEISPTASWNQNESTEELEEVDIEEEIICSDNDSDLELMEIGYKPGSHLRLDNAPMASKPLIPWINQPANGVAANYEDELMKLSEKMFEILEEKPDPSQDLSELIEPTGKLVILEVIFDRRADF